MDVLTTSDIEYLSTQSSDKLNLILTGMTSLMEDTQSKATLMENQPWYKRMANTITGKNKMTVEDISRNHEKINVYMSEAISELYNRNCIDQIELKQMLGAFVTCYVPKNGFTSGVLKLKLYIEDRPDIFAIMS